MAVRSNDLRDVENEPLRVLLADDQAWLRSAVKLLLEQEPGVVIVGEAIDGATLTRSAALVRPDIVLLDWELPGLDRLGGAQALLQRLRQLLPYLQVIVLSGRPESPRSALAAGATAFVSKADPPEQLLTALHSAQQTADMQYTQCAN